VGLVGFILFLVAGFVFGYAAPGRSAFLPVLLPFFIGLYTGVKDGFDSHVILFTVIGIVVAIGGVLAGRALLYRLEGEDTAHSSP
jgi:hypothetical protein